MRSRPAAIRRRRLVAGAGLSIALAVAVILVTSGGKSGPPPIPLPGIGRPAKAGDPVAYVPARESDFVARALAGSDHVLFVKSPGGALATAARVAAFRPLIDRAAAGTGIDPSLVEALVFVGRIVHELPGLTSRLVHRIAGARTSTRLATEVGTWATVLAVVLVAGSMFGAAHRQIRLERQDLRHERARTALIGRLSRVVSILGAKNIFACGQPNIPIEYQSIFAWYAGVKTGVLYVSPGYLRAHPHPLVNIYPIAGPGWKVFPSHVDPAHAAACKPMVHVYR